MLVRMQSKVAFQPRRSHLKFFRPSFAFSAAGLGHRSTQNRLHLQSSFQSLVTFDQFDMFLSGVIPAVLSIETSGSHEGLIQA